MQDLEPNLSTVISLSGQPLLQTDTFFPSNAKLQNKLQLPYGLIYSPFAIDIDAAHALDSSTVFQCDKCRGIANCFCRKVGDVHTCCFCGAEIPACQVPESNIAVYNFDNQDTQPPVITLTVDVTYEKGLDYLQQLFRDNVIRNLLEIPDVSLGIFLFASFTHYLKIEGEKIELVTFTECDDNDPLFPYVIPSLKNTYDVLYKLFSVDYSKFKSQALRLDREYRNTKLAISISQMAQQCNDLSDDYEIGGLLCYYIVFGED